VLHSWSGRAVEQVPPCKCREQTPSSAVRSLVSETDALVPMHQLMAVMIRPSCRARSSERTVRAVGLYK